ncbi:MAG TPA: amidohydrolase family protein, partial [Pyrinomonadaceae bacterium]|nr:amidohydrolase family protein [Pyrinomonadaceae bacterium]
YHLRLQKMERAILGARTPSSADGPRSELAALLFDCATVNGARSIGSANGTLDVGKPADFFTVDLNDPSIAGASPDDLLSSITFSASRSAVREVAVGGKPIVSEGQHLIQEEIVERFRELQKRLWA